MSRATVTLRPFELPEPDGSRAWLDDCSCEPLEVAGGWLHAAMCDLTQLVLPSAEELQA